MRFLIKSLVYFSKKYVTKCIQIKHITYIHIIYIYTAGIRDVYLETFFQNEKVKLKPYCKSKEYWKIYLCGKNMLNILYGNIFLDFSIYAVYAVFIFLGSYTVICFTV